MSDTEELEVNADQQVEQEYDPELDTLSNQVAVRVIRTILALNDSNTPITKANLQRLAWGDVPLQRANFNIIIKQANKELYETFGYVLKPLPFKETKINGIKAQSKTQQYVLVNGLSDPYLKFIQESSWLPSSKALFASELSDERHDYRHSKEEFPTLTSDEQLLFNGLTLTVISLIIVSNNHINETELLKILNETFGVDLRRNLDILNVSPVEFLKQLDKADYVQRTVFKDAEQDTVEYAVGRRAKAEFDRDSFTQFFKIIYDEEEDTDEFTRMVDKTLEATFGPQLVE